MVVEHMTMDEFREQLVRRPLAVLPVGSIEQHGPHLPLGLDAMHAFAVAEATANVEPCIVLAPLYYGLCRSSSQHPGTIGISGETLRHIIYDIGLSLSSQGVKALCILSGHASGVHMGALREAGEKLLAATAMEVAVACVLELLPPGMLEDPRDSHAGELETSVAMHLWPELVRRPLPEPAYPSIHPFILTRRKIEAWPSGIWGSPTLASAEKGRQIFEAEVEAFARLIRELTRSIEA